MKIDQLKTIMELITSLKRFLFKEQTFQSELDTQLANEFIAIEKVHLLKPVMTDNYMKRGLRDFKYCLRQRQYKAIGKFQCKHDLSKREMSMGLRTHLIEVSGNKVNIKKNGPPLNRLFFYIIMIIASSGWFFFCKYNLIPSLQSFVNPLAVMLTTGMIYLCLIFYFSQSTLKFYFDAFRIRTRFKRMGIR